MSDRSPLKVPRRWSLLAAALFVLWAGYAVVVLQQVLLGLVPAFVLAGFYLAWRFLVAFEAIAAALTRIAESRERREE